MRIFRGDVNGGLLRVNFLKESLFSRGCLSGMSGEATKEKSPTRPACNKEYKPALGWLLKIYHQCSLYGSIKFQCCWCFSSISCQA